MPLIDSGLYEVIKGCRKGDEKSQLKLYRMVYGQLLSMARRYHINREDSLAQVNAAFLKILDGIDSYSGNGSFEGWCARIMHRVLIDEWRKNRSFNQSHQFNEKPEVHNDLDEASYNTAHLEMEAESLLHMLHQLPATTRHVFNLFAIEGYTHAEIAEMMGMSEGTSRWHVNQARTFLKKRLLSEMRIVPIRNAI